MTLRSMGKWITFWRGEGRLPSRGGIGKVPWIRGSVLARSQYRANGKRMQVTFVKDSIYLTRKD